MPKGAILTTSALHSIKESSADRVFSILLALSLCALPIVGVFAPRALSFLPALIGILGFVGYWALQKQRPELSKPALLIAGSTFFLALLSCLWSFDGEESFERCIKMLPVFLGGVLLFSLVRVQAVSFYAFFVKAFVVSITLAFGLNAFEMLSSGMLHSYFRGLENTFQNNLSHLNRGVVVTTLCLFPFFIALKAYGDSCRIRQLIYGVLVVLSVSIVFYLTDSQSAHLAFLVGFLILLFFPARTMLAWHGLLVFLIALVFVTPWLTQILFDLMPSLIEDIYWFRTSYAMERLEIWDFVSRYALQSLWIGHGIEITRMVDNFDTQMLYHGDTSILHPHNFSVQFWVEFGVLGALFLSFLFTYLFHEMKQAQAQSAKMYLSSFMAFISVAATGYGFWQGWFLGLLITLSVYCAIIGRYQAIQNKI